MISKKWPGEFDAVIGGETIPSGGSLVLGGIQSVKNRLKSAATFDTKIAALEDAMNYGDEGLDLVIESLNDSSLIVQMYATSLLNQSESQKAKQALINYNPWLIFTNLSDWKVEPFNSEIGILNPNNTAYVVKNKQQLQGLIQDCNCNNLKVLRCHIEDRNLYRRKHLQDFFQDIALAKDLLPNLRALFIGDTKELMSSQVYIYKILPILKAYPNLELLKVRGQIDNENFLKLDFEKQQAGNTFNKNLVIKKVFQHANLKSLIIEADELSKSNITKIFNLSLPSLEYLELQGSFGLDIESLNSLFKKSFPNLLYLGLINTRNTNAILKALIESPIIDNLKILNLSQGDLRTLEDIDLLKSPKINQLYTLNISKSCFKSSMLEKLNDLRCQVIADSQESYRYDSLCE